MAPSLKAALIASVLCALAVWSGFAIAQAERFGPLCLALLSLLLVLGRLNRLPWDVSMAGLAIVGYLVGNRGFAQLAPPGLPLFPAEALWFAAGLGVALRNTRTGLSGLFQGALARMLVLWMVFCGVRLAMDIRGQVVLALRDFATVYYAWFFFAARDWIRWDRRWLSRCLLAGAALAPLSFELFRWAPNWISEHTYVLNTPLIYIKSDSAAALMAGAAGWLACQAQLRRHWGYAALALLLTASTVFSNSRAAMLSLIVVLAWFAVARAWMILRVTAVAAMLVAIALATLSLFGNRPWHENELYRTYERFVSMVDLDRTHHYRSSVLQDKADNNEFRMVWWAVVVRDTWTNNKWFGQGFGVDLGENFSTLYYAGVDAEFSTRSPHNIMVTLFGRTGLIGLALFLVLLAFITRDTWQLARTGLSDALGHHLFAWAILVAALFGVVLEGPMGAVLFWINLGIGSTLTAITAAQRAAAPTAALHDPPPAL